MIVYWSNSHTFVKLPTTRTNIRLVKHRWMFTRNRVIDVGCEQNNLDRLTYMFRKTYMCIHTRALFITLQLKLFSQLKTTVHRFQNVISLLDATTNQCIYIICIYVRPSEPQLKLDTVGTAEKRSPETSDSPSAAMDAL